MSYRYLWAVIVAATLVLGGCDNTTPDEHLRKAHGYFDSGEYRTAVIELKNALQKQPDLGDARFLLGRTQLILGDYPSALKEFERAIDLGIEDERLELEYLISKNRLGRHQEVIGALTGSGPLTPEFAAVLGDAYLAGGDLDKARSLFQQADKLASGRMGLGVIAWMQGDPAAARAFLTDATVLAPLDRDTWLRQAEFELSEGELSHAVTSFRTASDLPGGSLSGKIGMARAHLAAGELDLAAAQIDEVLRSSSGLPVAHYLDALIRYQRQDIAGAETALREVQRALPNHAPSLYLMGAVKFQQEQLSQAADNLQRFLAQDRGNESAAKLLAAVRMKQGDLQAVLEALQPFLSASRDPQLLAMAGTVSLQLGRTSQATELLERAVELAPDAAPFRNQLALSLLSSGEEDRAAVELESAIAVDGKQFQSDLLIAMLRMKEGDYPGAVQASDAIIAKNPASPLGYNLKGAALLGTGDFSAARSAFEAALSADPGFLPAASNLSRLDRRDGDDDRARQRFEDVLAASPDNQGALLKLADLDAVKGRYDQAEGYLLQVVKLDPDNIGARLGLLRLHLVRNRLTAAAEQADTLMKLAPENVDVLLLAAEVALREGDSHGALSHSERLQSIVSDRRGIPATLLAGLGTLQSRTGQTALARRNLEAAIAADPDTANRKLISLELARLDLRERRIDQARVRLTDLIASDPQRLDVRLLSADLLMAEGDYDAARNAYESLAEDRAREGVMRLAMLRQQQGFATAAVEGLNQWLRDNPEDVGAKLLRADALMRQQDKSAAIAQYEQLVPVDSPVVLNNLAWLYMERGDQRALATAERAAQLAPDNPDVLDTFGWVLVQSGEPRRAIEQLQRSLQLNPENPTVRYHLGIAQLDSGDSKAASATLRAALEQGEFPEAADARERLAALSAS